MSGSLTPHTKLPFQKAIQAGVDTSDQTPKSSGAGSERYFSTYACKLQNIIKFTL
jgi:hypothetical protein